VKIPKKILTWICSQPHDDDEEDEKKEVTGDKKNDYGTNGEKEEETKE
jgi:hypothetical protein